MKKIHLLFIACSIVIASCSGKKSDLDFTNDLENARGWSDARTIVKGVARSGEYMSKTDTNIRFGHLFKANLADISDKKLKTIKASVWANETVLNEEAVLVIIVDSANKTVVWKGEKLSSFVKEPNKWTEVITAADISSLKPSKDYIVSMYVWNTGKTTIYTDDHRIKFD